MSCKVQASQNQILIAETVAQVVFEPTDRIEILRRSGIFRRTRGVAGKRHRNSVRKCDRFVARNFGRNNTAYDRRHRVGHGSRKPHVPRPARECAADDKQGCALAGGKGRNRLLDNRRAV